MRVTSLEVEGNGLEQAVERRGQRTDSPVDFARPIEELPVATSVDKGSMPVAEAVPETGDLSMASCDLKALVWAEYKVRWCVLPCSRMPFVSFRFPPDTRITRLKSPLYSYSSTSSPSAWFSYLSDPPDREIDSIILI